MKKIIIFLIIFLSFYFNFVYAADQTINRGSATKIPGYKYSKKEVSIDANTASYTFDPNINYNWYEFTCNESSGCNIVMGEGSTVNGRMEYIPITVINMGTNSIIFADTNGVSEFTPGSSLTLDIYDLKEMVYLDANFWVEDHTGNN